MSPPEPPSNCVPTAGTGEGPPDAWTNLPLVYHVSVLMSPRMKPGFQRRQLPDPSGSNACNFPVWFLVLDTPPFSLRPTALCGGEAPGGNVHMYKAEVETAVCWANTRSVF